MRPPARIEAQIPCPKCGRPEAVRGLHGLFVPREDQPPPRSDPARIQQALDLLGAQVKGVKVNVKVTRKS